MMNDDLKKQLKFLGLQHLSENWDTICAQATKQKLSYHRLSHSRHQPGLPRMFHQFQQTPGTAIALPRRSYRITNYPEISKVSHFAH